jgi:hypothetical protein
MHCWRECSSRSQGCSSAWHVPTSMHRLQSSSSSSRPRKGGAHLCSLRSPLAQEVGVQQVEVAAWQEELGHPPSRVRALQGGMVQAPASLPEVQEATAGRHLQPHNTKTLYHQLTVVALLTSPGLLPLLYLSNYLSKPRR